MLTGQTLTMMDALLISISGMAIVMLELVLIACMILIMAKVVGGIKAKDTTPAAPAVAPPVAPPAGDEEEMHAVVMAVISHEMQVPLDQLNFKSIR